MNKAELRQSFVELGWEVEPVASWIKVSKVQGKAKYDVNVASPDNVFATAQVIVAADGSAAEIAMPSGSWEAAATTFDEAVRAYASGLEGGAVFAVAVTDINEADEVGLATAYMNTGSVENYVIKRRAGAFSFNRLL